MSPAPGTPNQPQPNPEEVPGEYADFRGTDVPVDADPDHEDDLRWMLVGRGVDSTVIELRWMLVGGDTDPTAIDDTTIDDATVSIVGLVAAYERGPSRDGTAHPPASDHQEEPRRLSAKAAERKEMEDHIHKEHVGAWVSANASHETDVYKIDPETGLSRLRENGSLDHLTKGLRKSIIRTERRYQQNEEKLRLNRQHHH